MRVFVCMSARGSRAAGEAGKREKSKEPGIEVRVFSITSRIHMHTVCAPNDCRRVSERECMAHCLAWAARDKNSRTGRQAAATEGERDHDAPATATAAAGGATGAVADGISSSQDKKQAINSRFQSLSLFPTTERV